MMKLKYFVLALCMGASFTETSAQEKLYPNTFPLSDVTLLDGPFKQACELNIKVLMQYDTDRLLAPFLKEAGLQPKGEMFTNWEGLAGQIGGHYLSALAIHYAATGNAECKERMEYMLAELKRCQDKHGNGYLAGIPNGAACWEEVKKGNQAIVWKYWVPWYNIHKTYAGLRDAWLYGGSEVAKEMFLKLCDWGIEVITPLTDKQMEQMLDQEFGGMDEVYADAYQMTGEEKYLAAAKRFSHRWLLDSMVAGVDNLDNKHANTQVPKAVGYQRIAELAADGENYDKAATFFWETVVNNRSLALGGNSRREHFASASDCISYADDREGPESCNTYNMMKLSEGLFRMTSDARYADFYERAMFNHILSTQHPHHGGYVYFTSARPAHYRVYSSPNSAMWCCVGTGMENHGKYGQFIYTHQDDALYVNLFVASELNWKEKGVRVTQETDFPHSEKVKLTIHTDKKVKATLKIRHPWWTKEGAMQAVCKGKDYAAGSTASSYIEINRKWKDGDVVEIALPMKVTIEELPNVPEYVAIMRGPILMGARMGEEGLDGLVADDGRWSHIAHGPLVSLFDTPFLIGERKAIEQQLEAMEPVPGKPMHFTLPGLLDERFKHLELEPFAGIHDSRYMMYWLTMTADEYEHYKQTRKEEEAAKLELDARTVDAISTGEQQPEADHRMKSEKSARGHFRGEPWRDAEEGGYFSYEMATNGEKELTLMVRYWGQESGKRTFDILVDGERLATENLTGKWNEEKFINQEYSIPSAWLEGKEYVTITFRPHAANRAGGVFYLRLLK